MDKLEVFSENNGILKMSGLSSFAIKKLPVIGERSIEMMKSPFGIWWSNWGNKIFPKKI